MTREPKFDQPGNRNYQTYNMDTMKWNRLNLIAKILKTRILKQNLNPRPNKTETFSI